MSSELDPSHFVYVDNVNTNLVCCICRMPFIEPTVTLTCAHTFCWDCINCALAVNLQCPVDRSPLTKGDLQPASTIVRNLVDELVVECPHKGLGCLYTCQRQHLSSHLSDSCEYVQVRCSHPSCTHTVLKKDLGKHSEYCMHRLVECEACGHDVRLTDMELHHDECPATVITCVHCTSTLPRSALVTHLATCDLVPIPCVHSSYGCTWTGPRRTLSPEHLQTCSYEAVKGFFAITASKFETMETENRGLRETIARLEKTVRAHERDLDIAKHRLGPWFKPSSDSYSGEGDNGVANTSAESIDATIRPERFRRRLSAPLNAVMFGSDSGSERVSAFDLSASFSALGTHMSPPSNDNRPLPSVAHPPQSVHAMPTPFYRAQSNSNSAVAPVSLTTSLEGTLNSLRSSIVALSGSLDSLERKQDIMLTTETLRMHEDVASLRAIVHGLRMQVHTMMMDRNTQMTGRMTMLASNLASGNQLNPTAQPNVPEQSTTYTTVSRFPHGFATGVSHSPNNSDVDSMTHGSIEMGVSSAARYLNQHPPVPYQLSPNVTTSTTSTSQRRPIYENKL